MENNQSEIEKIGEIIKSSSAIAKKILLMYDDKDLSFPFEFTMISFLERYTYTLKTVYILLKDLYDDHHYESPIGLILRTSLADLMLISHVAINSKDDKSLNDHLCHLLHDHIPRTNSFLKLNRKKEIIDESKLQKMLKQQHDKWDFLINHQDFTLKGKEFPDFKKIFEEMEDNNDMKPLSGVYDLYSYYSKYEHFGIQTYFMQRDNSERDILRIGRGVFYSLFGIKIILKYLRKDEFVKEIDTLILKLQV